MDTLEGLDHIASIVASVTIFATAIVGAVQWKRWKDEKRFEIEFESAVRIMKVAYRAQLSLHEIQKNEFHESEQSSAINSLVKRGVWNADVLKNPYVVEAQALLNRLEEIKECYREIADLLQEAKMLFGNYNMDKVLYDLSECFNELRRITNLVIIDINKGSEYNEEKRVNEVNKLNNNIDSIVNSIEEVILPIIRYKKYKKKS